MINENAINEFLKKIETDADFAKEIYVITEPLEIQALTKSKGIDLTLEDIMASKDILYQALDSANESELSEAQLDEVAGGIAVTSAILIGAGLAAAGTLVSAGLAATATLLADSIKAWKW